MSLLVVGQQYRLTRPMDLLGNGTSPRRSIPKGAVVTFVETRDYLDWFCCIVEYEDERWRVGYGLSNLCVPA